jgi:formamidopyrimidine-DNA glycosylase
MPELPDVETFCRYLNRTGLHKKIIEVEISDTRILERISAAKLKEGLKGRSIEKGRRRGKYLPAELDNNRYLILHFGMTGELAYYKHESEQPDYGRVTLRFDNSYYLSYISKRLLGKVSLVSDIEDYFHLNDIGPDALAADKDTVISRIRRSRGKIKSALMNQKKISGIGNIYSDEILFQAGIHPERDCGTLDQDDIDRIYAKIRKVLETAIDQQADPNRLPEDFLLPHRNEGESCPSCGGTVKQGKLSGRSYYFCPSCQREK